MHGGSPRRQVADTAEAACAAIRADPRLAPLVDAGVHRRFPGLPGDVRHARQFARAELEGLPLDLVETAVLLTSELVTNAVLHTAGPLVVSVILLPERLVVSVADDDAGAPRLHAAPGPDALAESGRGFQVIAAEADDFGWQVLPGKLGKAVWFALRIRHR
jgi:anti-sigma regulatory factor (Ser/Thr protein kinase)